MAKRFDGRISSVLKTQCFKDSENLPQTLRRYVYWYDEDLSQSALSSLTPQQTMAERYKKRPDLFNQQPYNHTELNS